MNRLFVVFQSIILYYIILYYIILYCFILYYIILYYIILYCFKIYQDMCQNYCCTSNLVHVGLTTEKDLKASFYIEFVQCCNDTIRFVDLSMSDLFWSSTHIYIHQIFLTCILPQWNSMAMF